MERRGKVADLYRKEGIFGAVVERKQHFGLPIWNFVL